MKDKTPNDGFIMDIWEKIFGFLSKISLFYLIRKMLDKKIKKPYTFVEGWVVGNLFAAIIGSLLVYKTHNKVIVWIVFIYGISRVFEIIMDQLNVILFDPYRAQKKNIKYMVKSVSRMLILLIHNYVDFAETLSGLILTIVSLARCINTLPMAEEIDNSK